VRRRQTEVVPRSSFSVLWLEDGEFFYFFLLIKHKKGRKVKMLVKILLLIIFFGIMVTVGVLCRKYAKNVNSFVIGGRSVGPWLSAFAYGTTYFSAVIFVGYAGQFGWKFGMSATWIGIGNAMIGSFLAWIILGRRTRLITQHLSSATMPEFFEKRYLNRSLRIGASFIIFIFLIPYTASLYNGLSRLFSMAFNIDYTVCIIAMSVLTAVYVILGGYMASAINDFIQGIIMLGGIIAVITAVLNLNGGFSASYLLLSQAEDAAVNMPGAFASFFGPSPKDLLFVVILTSLGTWGLPQMVHKFYAIRNENDIRKGTIISTVFAIVVAGGCYFLGGFGRLFPGIDVASNGYDSIIPAMLEKLPDILIGIVVILVLSASMSTLSSLVMTSSSTLTLDFIKIKIAKNAGEKTLLLMIRILIAVFIAVSAVIAIVQFRSKVSFIAQLMGISWGALAGAFLAPFLYGLYWKRATAASVWTTFIFGAALMAANFLFNGSFPALLRSSINCGAFAMIAGLVLVPVVSVFTKPPKKNLVDEMFSCYDTRVSVKINKYMGE